MKIIFPDQAINWWFADRYLRCDFSDGILGTRFIKQTSSSKIDTFSSIVVVTGWPLPLQCSANPVSLIFLIKLWTAMQEHSKFGCSFQILYAFQPFSLKSFSMTAFCLSIKTILLRSSELGSWNVRAKTSNFNRLWFALQWLLALPRLLYKAKTKENKLIQVSFKCWKQAFL